MEQKINIEWVSKNKKAVCQPNPDYPEGKDVDATLGREGKWTEVPYPAPECGVWIISGEGLETIAVTAAGRVDDPRNVKVAYRSAPQEDGNGA